MSHALASTTLTVFPSVSGHFTHCWAFRSVLHVTNSIGVAVPIYSISDLYAKSLRRFTLRKWSCEVLSLEKSGEAKKRPSHIGRAGFTPSRTWKSGAVRANSCRFPRTSLNTGFPTPFLRSLMLGTCARAPSAGKLKAPVSSPSGKGTLSFAARISHKGANCFPFSRFSSDPDWGTTILVLLWQNGPSICGRKPSSFHRATKSSHLAIVSNTSLADR